MPGGNGTGPAGMGPMTGRGAGFCAGFRVPGFVNRGSGGGGFGRGAGGGGWRNRMAAGWNNPVASTDAPGSVDSETELEHIERQAGALEARLEALRKRLKDLK